MTGNLFNVVSLYAIKSLGVLSFVLFGGWGKASCIQLNMVVILGKPFFVFNLKHYNSRD